MKKFYIVTDPNSGRFYAYIKKDLTQYFWDNDSKNWLTYDNIQNKYALTPTSHLVSKNEHPNIDANSLRLLLSWLKNHYKIFDLNQVQNSLYIGKLK